MADRPAPDAPDVPDGTAAEGTAPADGSADGPDSGPPADPLAGIVDEVRARFGDDAAGPAVAIYLAARGYDAARVTAVLARLGGDAAGHPGGGPAFQPPGSAAAPPVQSASPDPDDRTAAPGQPRPLRAWGAHERARFTPEAWGRLLQLRAAGLGDAEFEHLVDRALLQLEGRVTLPELRALLGDALGPGDAAPPTLH